jgi:hypothetical protein
LRSTVTLPFIPGCTTQWYVYVPCFFIFTENGAGRPRRPGCPTVRPTSSCACRSWRARRASGAGRRAITSPTWWSTACCTPRGLDHEDDEAARRMEARETEVLARFGIADPYR